MGLSNDLADLFHRDLIRLRQQIEAFPERDVLWECAPGVTNSAGNLALHLEGNLRQYVGLELGGVPYRRERDQEFTLRGLAASLLAARIEEVRLLVPRVIRGLSEERLETIFPGDPLRVPMSTRQFLIHLHGHLNYHLGQIDYLRRFLTRDRAIDYAGL